jgi:hypothetical protein
VHFVYQLSRSFFCQRKSDGRLIVRSLDTSRFILPGNNFLNVSSGDSVVTVNGKGSPPKRLAFQCLELCVPRETPKESVKGSGTANLLTLFLP